MRNFLSRLDMVLFTISQPDSESVCSGDYFEVAGATNTVPTICGFNNGQHSKLIKRVLECIYITTPVQ